MENLSHSFFCQKCYSPININESFHHITENLSDLKSFLNIEDNFNKEIVLPVTNSTEKLPRKNVPPDPNDQQTDYYGDVSDLSESTMPSDRIKVAAYLFDYLSGHTEMDHPLCQDCADALLNAQDKNLKHFNEEMIALKRYLNHLEETQPVPPSPRSPITASVNPPQLNNCDQIVEDRQQSLQSTKDELEQLSIEEQRLMEDLKSLMSKEKDVEEEIVREKGNVTNKEDELDRLTAEYNQEKLMLLAQEDELKALDCKLKHSREQLERLKKTNVLNLAFNIWYEGHLGLINGLRLGRLPSNPVDWPEINAAWGQCVLLLSSIAKKMNFNFHRYRLVPMGSTSSIINVSDNKEMPLYHTGGVKLFGDSKFDQAMVYYTDCVSQMQTHIEKSFGVPLPFKFLEKGKIQDSTSHIYSIKLHLNNEESWTKALKYVLITLKWLLTSLITRQASNLAAGATISTVDKPSTSNSKT